MTALLASVRDVAEARLALRGGAQWIDLKEPAAGALGAVPLAVARQVAAELAGVVPMSATIGDCWRTPELIVERVRAFADSGVPFVKVGLFARRPPPATLRALTAAADGRRVIAVCFAEAAPDAEDVARLVAAGVTGVMLDTADKEGAGLRARLSDVAIAAFVVNARRHGVLIGLAGSLRVADVAPLALLAPDYLGFRGALCAGQRRNAAIEAAAVRGVRDALDAAHASMPAAGTSRPLAVAAQSEGEPPWHGERKNPNASIRTRKSIGS